MREMDSCPARRQQGRKRPRSRRPANKAAAAAAAALLSLLGPTSNSNTGGSSSPLGLPLAAAQSTCRDNLAYRSRPAGLNCVQHTYSRCGASLRGLGYTDADLAELWINCPKSCGLLQRRCDDGEDGADDANDGGEEDGGGEDWTATPRQIVLPNSDSDSDDSDSNAAKYGLIDAADPDARPQHADSIHFYGTISSPTCHADWSPLCQDNPTFVSEEGIPGCTFHTSVLLPGEDCTAWTWAYSPEQVLELLENCPCSCGVECGEATPFPTPLPTAAPTAGPSAMPSAAPTAAPSAVPSARPTASPSAGPSAAPTARPSAAPSGAPTAGPSAAPSGPPSDAPTGEPSAPRRRFRRRD